jgi:hypothetical protein
MAVDHVKATVPMGRFGGGGLQRDSPRMDMSLPTVMVIEFRQ